MPRLTRRKAGHGRYVLAVETDPTGGGRGAPRRCPQQRGLAGAVGAHQCERLAVLDGQRDAADRGSSPCRASSDSTSSRLTRSPAQVGVDDRRVGSTACGSPSAMTVPRPCDQPIDRLDQHVHDVLDPHDRDALAAQSRIVSTSAVASSSVSPAPISSRSRTEGPVASARASSSRLRSRSPRLSAPRFATPSIPQVSSTSMERRYASRRRFRPPMVAPTKTFSKTVMPANGLGTWCARPTPRWQRRAAELRVTSWPRSSTRPPSGRRAPARMLSNVVLPAPLGPTIPTESPSPSWRLTPLRTSSAPNPSGCLRPRAAASRSPSGGQTEW